MLFKILGIERVWFMSPESLPKPRQVFVTQASITFFLPYAVLSPPPVSYAGK
jgi:hypothetical protein